MKAALDRQTKKAKRRKLKRNIARMAEISMLEEGKRMVAYEDVNEYKKLLSSSLTLMDQLHLTGSDLKEGERRGKKKTIQPKGR